LTICRFTKSTVTESSGVLAAWLSVVGLYSILSCYGSANNQSPNYHNSQSNLFRSLGE
jgi:hypothetical protein